MSLHPVLLMNDGSRLDLARVDPDGTVRRLRRPLDIPVEHRAMGRFRATAPLVIDPDEKNPQYVFPDRVEPALPPCPGFSGTQWTRVLSGDRGFALPLRDDDREYAQIYDDGSWTKAVVPDGVRISDAQFDDTGWVAIGNRDRRPILFDPTTGAEISFPWRRRWRDVLSEKPLLSLSMSREGLVVQQDDGHFDRIIKHVYLRTSNGWLRRFVGQDYVSTVNDRDGQLPPVLLGMGRWLAPGAGSRLDVADPLGFPPGMKRYSTKHTSWRSVCVADSIVTALVCRGPELTKSLLRAPLGDPLQSINTWGVEEHPVDLTVADVSGFEWI